jgi:hypothetical protein
MNSRREFITLLGSAAAWPLHSPLGQSRARPTTIPIESHLTQSPNHQPTLSLPKIISGRRNSRFLLQFQFFDLTLFCDLVWLCPVSGYVGWLPPVSLLHEAPEYAPCETPHIVHDGEKGRYKKQ